MAGRSRWLIAGLVVVALAAGILFWRGCRGPSDRVSGDSGDFNGGDVALLSPDLDLELVSVRAEAKASYTDWACLLECREPGGCRADVRVRISYQADGDERTLMLGGRIDAARGETVRIGRVQRPVTTVERVREVAVEVAGAVTGDGPRPTPVQ